MATDQVRIRSLYEGLYRTVILFGLLIAAAWLFAVFSYYLSRKMGSDWFSRRARSWLWLERQSASQLPPARAREALDPMSQPKHQRAEAQQVSDYSDPQSCSFAQTPSACAGMHYCKSDLRQKNATKSCRGPCRHEHIRQSLAAFKCAAKGSATSLCCTLEPIATQHRPKHERGDP